MPQKPICGARLKYCRQCKRKYQKDTEYELMACPDCGMDRHCVQTKTYPNGRCRVHGGPTPRGISSPLWQGGFAIAIGANNKRQQELYEQYLRSEELREHTTSMAFFASRRDTLLEGTKGAEFYQSILEALDEFEAAIATTDKPRKDLAFSTLRVLIKQGGEEAKRWKEIYSLEEKLGRARERQDRREIQQRMVVPLAEFYMARSQFVDVVRRAIDQILDGDLRDSVLRHIQLEVERLAEHEPATPEDLGQIG